MDREFSLGQLQQLTGVDVSMLRQWIKAELIRPCRYEKISPRGPSPYFSVQSVMAAALIRVLKKRGATLTYIAPIAEFVGSLTVAEIEAAVADDLAIVSAGNSLPPCFQPMTGALVNRTGFKELVFAASIRSLWQQTLAGIDFIDRQSAALN